MIKVLRLDERLIHGQVANEWSRKLDVEAIVVANDSAATDDLLATSLRMAAPGDKKVVIKKVEDAINILNDPRAANMSIFVVCDNPADALKLVKGVKDIPYLNVGNFGRIGFEKANRKEFTSNLYANDEEVKIFKEIIATGIDCEFRTLITDKKVPLDTLFK